MRTLQSTFPKEGVIRIMEGYGLGWRVGTFHGTELCSHGGGYPGASAYCALLPEKNSGFAILMNSGGAAGGLQDVIAVDILDRLIDGDEHVDVMEAYRRRVSEQRPRFAEREAERRAAMARPFELTRDAAAYEGRFASADLGTMTITPDGSRLKVTWGECELDVAPAGPDAFKSLGPTGESMVFTFAVSPDGGVAAIGLDGLEEGTLLFERSGWSVTIDERSFPHYPGVLVSLDRVQVIALPARVADLKTTDADVWIEPRDPEIAALTTGAAGALGIAHEGRDARVALTTGPYDAIVHVPEHSTWLERLPVEAVSAGRVFLVQSSGGRYYKVRIDAWDKGDAGGGSMRLSFARITGP